MWRSTHRGWLLVCLLSLAAGLTLTALVRRTTLLPGEIALAEFASQATPAFGHQLARTLDWAFTDYTAPALFACMVPLVWWRWGRAAAVLFALAGSLTGITKLADLAARPRPTSDLTWSEVIYGEGGYPSGHTVYAVIVFGFLALLARRNEPPGRGRDVFVGAMVALVVVSGPARVVVLAHWPADVAGSYLLAVPLLGVAVWTHDRAPLIAQRLGVEAWLAPPVVPEETSDPAVSSGSGP